MMYPRLCIYRTTSKSIALECIEEQESRFITKVAKEASINAIKDTFRHGRPVMTLQNESIVRKYPDGRTETVRKIEKMPLVLERRIYHL